MNYEIKPIRLGEWLPDRCMPLGELDLMTVKPEAGCHSLNGFYTEGNRTKLINLYHDALESTGCCGFIAWHGFKVIGYNNFFPHEVAKSIQFYGWGNETNNSATTLVHHCISIAGHPEYRRKGIGTALIKHSLDWAKHHGWKQFEVHLVLPDNPSGFNQEQKSCCSFWKKFGFEVVREIEADSETKTFYSVNKRYSMALDLEKWQVDFIKRKQQPKRITHQ